MGIGAAAIALPAQGQEEGRTLRVAIPKDYSNLSVYTAGASDADPFVGLVYDTLFTTPYVDKPEPLLAESAKPDRANRVWTVKLRDGVVWDDGRPFDAGDVKFSYELYRNGPPNRWTHHASESPDMERIDVVDELTLRIACAQPCPTLDRITLADLPIVAEHQWRGIGQPTEFDGDPVGTGPYRIVRRVPGERYELAANTSYFAGRPVADRLILPIIPDPSASFLALRGGQVDAVARPLPPQLVDGFADDSQLRVLDATPFSDAELAFNMARPPFDQRAFRRAAMLAIDKDRLLETVMLGRGTSGAVGWPHPDSPWTEEPGDMPHDPDEARRLLREAGLEGTKIEMPAFGATGVEGGVLGLDVAARLALPLATLTLATTASVFLIARSSLLSELSAGYVRFARAKGVPEPRIVRRHVLRNALLPIVTVLLANLGMVLGGAVVIETVFSYPGLGSAIYEAVLARDFPLLQGALLLAGAGVVAANAMADALYAAIDPRVRHGEVAG